MEGYLWKKGGLLSTMKRRYCVLKGTMLAYYTNEDEHKRKATPRAVLEVVQVRDWNGAAALKTYKHAIEIDYLGGATYQCHCDSSDEKVRWVAAIRHALDEPDRIMQDEIEDAQQQLIDDAETEELALVQAADAVRAAQQLGEDARASEQAMRDNVAEREALDEKIQHSRELLSEAANKVAETREALDRARQSAHDSTLNARTLSADADVSADSDASSGSSPRCCVASLEDDASNCVVRLAAQLEVDTTCEDTHARAIETLEQRVTDLSRAYAELFSQSRASAENAQQMRDTAATCLQQAQAAKQIAALRIESWTASASHLDPLAESYLLCKHPLKPSMHRRYYVLVGNTLCWYKDADAYAALPASPAGVVHVSGVADWTGKVGAMKVLPHAFSIETVEGKVLCCSAPTRHCATTWTTALHIGTTMPPLSPHRAVAAKSRRDSFDLMASMAALSPKRTTGHFTFPTSATDTVADSVEGEAAGTSSTSSELDKTNVSADTADAPSLSRKALETAVVVEGYLVKKSAFVPVMKKKYCVLRGLRLSIFDSHDAADAAAASDQHQPPHAANHEEITVCSVSDWDGHGALLHYSHGFEIATLRHEAIYCSAANKEEKDKWVHGIRAALLRHRSRLSPTRREDSMIDRARKSVLRRALAQSPPSGDSGAETDTNATTLDEFQALLHEYYAEHNASKLSDVPMLVERYRHRERALVEHLDRIYGTELAHDTHVIALLETLATPSQAPPPLARRKSSGVKSGLVDFVKMAGYLAWNGTRAYCVLSVHKLVRYRSQTQFETAPFDPLDAVVLSSVYEYPPPPDFVSSTATKHTFFVACTSDLGDDERQSQSTALPTLTLTLSAATVDEKLTWMAKIRSGLGFAHASAERASASTSSSGGASSSASSSVDASGASHSDATVDIATDALRTRLIAYYQQHNPRKVGEVEALLMYFRGSEHQLLRDLDTTYDTSIAHDPELEALVAVLAKGRRHNESPSHRAATDRSDAGGSSTVTTQCESYLWVKHPALGTTYQRCYCVLRDETWSCYASSRHAHADSVSSSTDESASEQSQQLDATPLLVDVVVQLHTHSERLRALDAALSIETRANGAVLLRADVDRLVTDWTRALRHAVDTYQHDEQERAAATTDEQQRCRMSSVVAAVPLDGPTKQLYDVLVAFYELHNRDKVAEVATLLHAFRGRERKLLDEIDAIYHTALRADATVATLLNDIAEHHVALQHERRVDDETTASGSGLDSCAGTSTTGSDSSEQILMEGYLVKRGHLVPSMRKRYCVLVKTTLTYYATHADSRNPDVAPHGRFDVAVVGDWNGKTATKRYDHGLELETADGKAFFCAAFSADDRLAWLRAFKHGIAIARAEQMTAAADTSATDTVGGNGSVGDCVDSDADTTRRAQFRDRLEQFYRETNPKKLADLDLLLVCYAQRELALLEAIDAAYGSALAHDAPMLALLPPSDAHSRALATLQYDGALHRCSDRVGPRRVQPIHVAMNGLVLAFYASSEGFQSGATANKSVTVLAVKDVDATAASSDTAATAATAAVASQRFAVETTEHVWLHFEAVNIVEKRHWVQLLQAALDTILAQSLFDEELELLQATRRDESERKGGDGVAVGSESVNSSSSWRGFLLVRLDFGSETEHARKRGTAVAMAERHVVLQSPNQLVISSDTQDAVVATFTALATRAWDPTAAGSGVGSDAPITSDTKCRFPFQVLTLEQIVLSCSAATDLLRAKWIKQIRQGAECASAMELLQEQQLQAQQIQTSGHASSSKREGESDEIIITPDDIGGGEYVTCAAASVTGDDTTMTTAVAIVLREYLDYRIADAAAVLTPTMSSSSSPLKEGYFVLTARAHVDVFVDEDAFHRGDAPLVATQVVELFDSLTTTTVTPAPQTPSSTTRRHLYKLFGDTAGSSATSAPAFTANLAFAIQTKDRAAMLLHVFPASTAQHDAWTHALRTGVDVLKGEELLADEKRMLRLEQAETDANATRVADRSDDDASTPATLSIAHTTPGVAVEGLLTPYRLAFGSSKPTAAIAPLFYVLVGCRLRSFSSADKITTALATTRTERDHGCLLDVEIVSVRDWELPTATAAIDTITNDDVEGVGFQLEIVAPPSQTKNTLYLAAPSSASKHTWVRAIAAELDFALAESVLDDEAHEFARQVAAHIAGARRFSSNKRGAGDESSAAGTDANNGDNTPRVQHIEGYVRVRHHFLGALWRERYAVLDATRLLLFADVRAAQSVDCEKLAVERHDLVGIDKWRPTFSTSLLGGSNSSNSSRAGFRVENDAGGYLECTVGSEREQSAWLAAVGAAVDAISSHASAHAMTRDAALPFVSGAAMEGVLKVRETSTRRLAVFWKTRYCVVMGTQWLLYESQTQALSSHGVIHSELDDDHGAAVPPLAVYEIAHADVWTRPEGRAARKLLVDDNDELAAHGFVVHVATGARTDCKAQSSLERKRWLNAIEDALGRAASDSAHVAETLARRSDAERAKSAIKVKYSQVQSDAERQAAVLQEALELAALGDDDDDDSSVSSMSSDASGTGDRDGDPNVRRGPKLRPRAGSDFIDRSPEWSPIRPKTTWTFGLSDNDDEAHKPHDDVTGSSTGMFAFSLAACFGCCSMRPPATAVGSAKTVELKSMAAVQTSTAAAARAGRSIAPLGVPGFPANADVWRRMYTCEYYTDDGYTSGSDW